MRRGRKFYKTDKVSQRKCMVHPFYFLNSNRLMLLLLYQTGTAHKNDLCYAVIRSLFLLLQSQVVALFKTVWRLTSSKRSSLRRYLSTPYQVFIIRYVSFQVLKKKL